LDFCSRQTRFLATLNELPLADSELRRPFGIQNVHLAIGLYPDIDLAWRCWLAKQFAPNFVTALAISIDEFPNNYQIVYKLESDARHFRCG
jgi:hypothetical protein